jgi:xanthomonalisin
MMHNKVIRLSSALLALAVVSCSDYDPFDPGRPDLEVSPLFFELDEGESLQLTATLNGQPVQVTWETSDPAIATVSPTGLVTGVRGGRASATATLVTDPTHMRSASVTVLSRDLESGVPKTDLAAPAGKLEYYRVAVPAGATRLTVRISGGTGDVDLYLRFGAQPTFSEFDCRPWLFGNNETCVINNPQAGTWHIMLDAYESYEGVTLEAVIEP